MGKDTRKTNSGDTDKTLSHYNILINLMNKSTNISLQAVPVRSQSPDLRNKHKIGSTSVQTMTIKRYLQSIKSKNNLESGSENSNIVKNTFWWHSQQKAQKYDHQQILRKRILQLQLQNNQFRMLAKQCENLATKNKELQEKMLILLSQIEVSPHMVQNLTASPFKRNPTKQGSTIEKDYTEQSGKQMPENQLTPNVQESQSYLIRQKQKHENSLINIQIDDIADSEHQLGKSNQLLNSKLPAHSLCKPSFFQGRQLETSALKEKLFLVQSAAMKDLLQDIEDIKEKLNALLSKQTQINGSTKIQFENNVYEKLQNIINSFFPYKRKQISSLICEENFRQSSVLREKMKFSAEYCRQSKNQHFNQQILRLSRQQRSNKMDSYHLASCAPSQQFQVTARKIKEFFEIMKHINAYFRLMLSSNKAILNNSSLYYSTPQAIKFEFDI